MCWEDNANLCQLKTLTTENKPDNSCILPRGHGMWASHDGSINISWTGSNFALTISGQQASTQCLSFYKQYCIPRLGCLQSTGDWRVVEGSKVTVMNVQVKLASAVEWTATAGKSLSTAPTHDIHHSSALTPLLSSYTRSTLPEVCTPLNDKLELSATSFKKRNVSVPSAVFESLLFFVTWDPVLRELDDPGSFELSALQLLLQKCLCMWADLNDEHAVCQQFHQCSILSLNKYRDRDPAPQATGWQSFYNKYGCIETSRLFTLKQRMMLMIACSWPFYFCDNTDQRNSGDLFHYFEIGEWLFCILVYKYIRF
jgi:hypothetical protein